MTRAVGARRRFVGMPLMKDMLSGDTFGNSMFSKGSGGTVCPELDVSWRHGCRGGGGVGSDGTGDGLVGICTAWFDNFRILTR